MARLRSRRSWTAKTIRTAQISQSSSQNARPCIGCKAAGILPRAAGDSHAPPCDGVQTNTTPSARGSTASIAPQGERSPAIGGRAAAVEMAAEVLTVDMNRTLSFL